MVIDRRKLLASLAATVLWAQILFGAQDFGNQWQCAPPLRVGKVALLFLMRWDNPHAHTWKSWLQSAADLVPVQALQTLTEDERDRVATRLQAFVQACPRFRRQFMFSIHTHMSPGFLGFETDNIFAGTELSGRISTERATHTLSQAARLLLRESLKDPWNKLFVLLSESCIPIYPPSVVWLQLVDKAKSSVDACKLDMDHTYANVRYEWTFRGKEHILDYSIWRKSSQWFALVRKHAQLVVDDTKYNDIFTEHCIYTKPDGTFVGCISDEHYVPVVLAAHGLANETECHYGFTHTDWTGVTVEGHPKHYTQEEISPELIVQLRTTWGWYDEVNKRVELDHRDCDYDAAIRSSCSMFLSVHDLAHSTAVARLQTNYERMPDTCPLFARKFPADTAQRVHDMFVGNDSRVHVLADSQCTARDQLHRTEEPPLHEQ